MNGTGANWIWITIIGACIAVFYLYRQGKIPWLKGLLGWIKMPKLFQPKPVDLTEKLKAQTEKETVKVEELRKVLEAKTKLAEARAENIRLQKEIDGVSERSVEKEKRVAKQKAQDAQEAKTAKPGRL